MADSVTGSMMQLCFLLYCCHLATYVDSFCSCVHLLLKRSTARALVFLA
uniref:Uncharacterized protein n=1 Tax=Rhizophora mucronata TaxID=61149 RepID=A0A2P2LFE5_RHIMU